MALKLFNLDKENLLHKILQANFTRALTDVRKKLIELQCLAADAPTDMPKEDIKQIEQFVKETDNALSRKI